MRRTRRRLRKRKPAQGWDWTRNKWSWAPQKETTAQATQAAQVSVRDRDAARDVYRADSGHDVECRVSSVECRVSSVETLNVLTLTRTGLQYRSMQLKNPLTSASELTLLPVMSWMRFAKGMYDGRIEQICILPDLKRMKSEAEELKQLH
ncbi:hypothetical protein PI125_g17725 [Phytophthora idaei]|nr:hypothetical protein PI125_g17725 [Phytophthora idaei]